MWIHKTPAEIAETERRNCLFRYSPSWPFIIALSFSTFMTVVRWAGFRGKFIPWGDPIPFSDALLQFLPIFIISFGAVYVFRLFMRLPSPLDGTVICTTCFETSAPNAAKQCHCGGELEPLYFWKWVQDSRSSYSNTRDA